MLLEERTADVFIETVGEVVIDVDQSFLQDVAGHAVFDAEHEQANKPLQSILIHWIDEREVYDAKEEQRCPACDWPVPLSGLIDLLFSDLTLFDSFVDLLTGLLRIRELVDQGLVFQELIDAALGA